MNSKIRLLNFVEFEKFYTHYQPLSVYGKKQKKLKEIYYETSRLQEEHALTQQGLQLLEKYPHQVVKLEYALQRISLLNSFKPVTYNSEDIFLIKKYIYNYDQIVKILNEIEGFELPNPFLNLKKILEQDGNRETFYLAGSFDPELKKVRYQIFSLQKEQKELSKEFLNLLKTKYGIDLRFRNFVVLPQAEANKLPNELFYLEPYDSNQVIVKPEYPKNYFALISQLEEIKAVEKQLEQEILHQLSQEINELYPELENTIIELTKVDRMLAKARLVNKLKLIKPEISESKVCIEIEDGIFLPLQETCRINKRDYQPLTVDFDKSNIVVLGSNMGGKTVLLQTVGFLQLLTQMGFYVPAKSFKTSLFQNICFIGSDNLDKIDGLSSFGREIYQFINKVQKEENGLFLLDEFAKTTNSREAASLISAVLSYLSNQNMVSSLWATHFTLNQPIDNVSYYRMKGLDHELFDKKQKLTTASNLAARIDNINEMMDYRVEKSTPGHNSQDALKIAETLGLDKKIIKHALQQLEKE